MVLRRSPRLRALHSDAVEKNIETATKTKPRVKRTKSTSKTARKKRKEPGSTAATVPTLPRTLEFDAHESRGVKYVMGIDEAGRGPLAGPVVAAAVIYPRDQEPLPGIVDSKKITREEEREKLYDGIVSIPNIRWAVCVIDAKRIDKINILQATLEAMRLTAIALTKNSELNIPQISEASIYEKGCYVVTSAMTQHKDKESEETSKSEDYFALIDGNKVPKEMPCDAECVVKGDGKEFAIAAGSILAKVTRDRLMHGYDELYPEYGLARHKGYPTSAHVAAINERGVIPIHRRTFAPIKHMDFDDE